MTTDREIVRVIADTEWAVKVRRSYDSVPDTSIMLKETLFESWYLFSHLDKGGYPADAKPVTLLHDACPSYENYAGDTNCTAICTSPDTLFGSWKTLWQCLSLAVLTIGNTTFSEALERPLNGVDEIVPKVQIGDTLHEFFIDYENDFDGREVLDLVYQCADASCRDKSMGDCSIGQLDAAFFQSDKLEWIQMAEALEPLCKGLESDINIDIAGPGVLITYITQTAMVMYAWLFFLILAITELICTSSSALRKVLRKSDSHSDTIVRRVSGLELLERTNLAHATSTFLAELHEAQCFFVVAIEIALINASSRSAVFTGAQNWQSLLWNRDSIQFLAGMGVWPIILGQITLRRAQLDSMYYLLLSTLSVVLAGVAADTASNPDPSKIYKMFENLNNLEECGGHPSLRTFCIEERASIYWFVFPARSIYAFLGLLAILWWSKLWSFITSSAWFLQKHKSVPKEHTGKWEWTKKMAMRTSAFVISVGEAGAFACICLGLGAIRAPLLNLLLRGETGTWSVGQLVAVLIWAPVISKYAHLVILGVEKGFRLRLSRTFDIVKKSEVGSVNNNDSATSI